jgi:hypothetical protein
MNNHLQDVRNTVCDAPLVPAATAITIRSNASGANGAFGEPHFLTKQTEAAKHMYPNRTFGAIARAVSVTAALIAVAVSQVSAQSTNSCQPGTIGCVGTLVSANWTHGVSIQVEDQSRIARLVRRGFGTEVLTYGQTWVHFAIPTPVAHSGERLRLQRIKLLWDANRGAIVVPYINPPIAVGAKIWAMHVWDGDVELAEFGNDRFRSIGQPYVPGVAGQDLLTNFLDIPGAPYVYYGIVVSLLIDAPPSGSNCNPGGCVLDLKAIGGDFYNYSSTAVNPNPTF